MRLLLPSRVASVYNKLSASQNIKLPPSYPLSRSHTVCQKVAAGLTRQRTPILAILAQTNNPNKRVKTSMGAVDNPLAGLEPANVWGFFNELTKIPRPSKHEEKCAGLCLPACLSSLLYMTSSAVLQQPSAESACSRI